LQPLADGTIRLRVLVDRASLEIYGNDGRVALPLGILFPEQDHGLEMFARGSEAFVPSLAVYPLRSVWG
jgi:fructan beta-fructosidase